VERRGDGEKGVRERKKVDKKVSSSVIDDRGEK